MNLNEKNTYLNWQDNGLSALTNSIVSACKSDPSAEPEKIVELECRMLQPYELS